MLAHTHDPPLVVLSVLIAILASYTALDLASSLTAAHRRARFAWLVGGSLAMGTGIWSMHFVAMLAWRVPGLTIAYDVPLLVLSVTVAILASAMALTVVTRPHVSRTAHVRGSLAMGAAIAGMHYLGITAMRMSARIVWNAPLVVASLLIAVGASHVALHLAFHLRTDRAGRSLGRRVTAAVVMGSAISGMHYTAMAAMHLLPAPEVVLVRGYLLASSGLAVVVTATTMLILGVALAGSFVQRALARRAAVAEQVIRILESISDAFYSVDRAWRFTYVNETARNFLRPRLPDDADLVGRVIWDVLPDLRDTVFEQRYREAMRTGQPAHFEAWHEAAGAWLEAHAHPSPEGLSVYFRDVTDRKRAEEDLHRALRVRDDFLSVASHELKTPLTSLKIQVQLRQRALQRGDMAFFSRERLERMVTTDARQIDRLARLVDEMLDVSRIQSGRLGMHPEDVELGPLAEDVVARYRDQLEAAGSPVRVTVHDAVHGHWDRFRIEQVLANLLTNAARYGSGLPVDVEVRRESDRALLVVRDRGPGVAPEDRERIFQAFERAAAPWEHGGLGLGLFIAREIVERHQGTIRVETPEDGGARFVVELPATTAPDDEPPDDEPPDA